jgi:hypothetical protein
VGEPVQDGVVDRQADGVAERAVAEGRGVVVVAGLRPALADPAADVLFEVEEVDTDVGEVRDLGEDLGDELPGRVHPLDLGGCLQLDHGCPHLVRWYNNATVAVAVLKYQSYPGPMVRNPLTPEQIEAGRRLGALLRQARAGRDLGEVARAAGMSPETLRKIETGRLPTPAFGTIACLSEVLALPIQDLAAVWRDGPRLEAAS